MKNNSKYLVCLAFLLMTCSSPLRAQDEGIDVFLHPKKFYRKFFPHLRVKKPKFDSLYIKSYPNFLTTGAHLLLPSIDLDIHSKSNIENASSASSSFRTNVGSIMAFSVSYRFITAGFAVVLSPSQNGKEDYASTRYRTATIKYNNAAYYLQFRYMRTKGFTDINSFNSQDPLLPVRRSDLRVKEFQFEGMYNFFWKRYSYHAPIDYTHRQLKTSAGLLLKAGVYYNELAADSNLLAVKQRPLFDDFDDVQQIRSTSFKLAPGIGANVVFLRRFYLSAAVFAPYNLYVYNVFTDQDKRTHRGTSLALMFDGNVSLGFQSERIYAGIRYLADKKRVKLNSVEMNTLFSYVGFDIGYRFVTPKFIRKVYKDTMPPGM